MPELVLNALPSDLRSLAVKARQAVSQGDPELASALCAQVLAAEPTCLEVRELQHSAQQELLVGKGVSLAQKLTGWLPRRGDAQPDTGKTAPTLAEADAVLAKDYRSKSGWTKLAVAAEAAELVETLLFARRAAAELHPADREIALAHGEALLVHGRPAEAVQAVKTAQAHHPHDSKLAAMLQRAAVAQTVDQGNWDGEGSFRDKLRNED
jgi:Flp pilus assembly protein TadD